MVGAGLLMIVAHAAGSSLMGSLPFHPSAGALPAGDVNCLARNVSCVGADHLHVSSRVRLNPVVVVSCKPDKQGYEAIMSAIGSNLEASTARISIPAI